MFLGNLDEVAVFYIIKSEAYSGCVSSGRQPSEDYTT